MQTFWPWIDRRAARFDILVKAYVALGRFSGAVLVARDGRVLFKKGYGMASYEHAVPNTPQTPFRIGSQTKTFTAIAILQLQEQGKLSVHDPLAAYLSGYPHGEMITIHQLLTNTSGIPDYITAEGFSRTMSRPHTVDELIGSFKDRPLLFSPGERFGYSNSGWVLLGALIERLAGMPYGDYVREHILARAGMERSGLEQPGQVLKDHAGGYSYADSHVIRAAHLDNSTQYAAGGLHATAEDLYRWDRSLYRDRLLSKASRELMFTPHVAAEGSAYGYGCILADVFGRRCIESSGGTIGFVTITTRYVDDDVAIVVLSNFEGSPYNAIERGLAAIVFGQPYELPTERSFVAVDPAIFEAYVGRYVQSFIGRTHIMDITREGDRLMVEVQGLQKTEMRPMSETRYFARMKGEVELTFQPSSDGPAQEITIIWTGHHMTARRVV